MSSWEQLRPAIDGLSSGTVVTTAVIAMIVLASIRLHYLEAAKVVRKNTPLDQAAAAAWRLFGGARHLTLPTPQSLKPDRNGVQ